MSLLTDIREVWQSRELLHNLTLRELRGKYKGTALGWGWSLVNPLMTAAIYTLVFSTIMRVSSFTGGMGTLVANGNLIKTTYSPRRLLLVSNTAAAMFSHMIELIVISILFMAWGINVLPRIHLVIVVEILLAIFSLGLGLLFSVVNVYFRDTTHFVGLFIQLWFYATPVIYPITLVMTRRDPGSWVTEYHLIDIYNLNPMLYFIEPIKEMLYSGTVPSWSNFAWAALVAVVSLWIGNAVFGKLEHRLAEEL